MYYGEGNIVIIDDVLATGGTLVAAIELARKCDAQITGILVLLEIEVLKGREFIQSKYPEIEIFSLVKA